ncbi:hypothetical protein ACKKBG_A36835 [Auxenochlorella protothecoides x Auxenochlorella symbiontica]
MAANGLGRHGLMDAIDQALDSGDTSHLVRLVFATDPSRFLPAPSGPDTDTVTTSLGDDDGFPGGNVLESVLEALQEVSEDREVEIQDICSRHGMEIATALAQLGPLQGDLKDLKRAVQANNSQYQALGSQYLTLHDSLLSWQGTMARLASLQSLTDRLVAGWSLCLHAVQAEAGGKLYRAYCLLGEVPTGSATAAESALSSQAAALRQGIVTAVQSSINSWLAQARRLAPRVGAQAMHDAGARHTHALALLTAQQEVVSRFLPRDAALDLGPGLPGEPAPLLVHPGQELLNPDMVEFPELPQPRPAGPDACVAQLDTATLCHLAAVYSLRGQSQALAQYFWDNRRQQLEADIAALQPGAGPDAVEHAAALLHATMGHLLIDTAAARACSELRPGKGQDSGRQLAQTMLSSLAGVLCHDPGVGVTDLEALRDLLCLARGALGPEGRGVVEPVLASLLSHLGERIVAAAGAEVRASMAGPAAGSAFQLSEPADAVGLKALGLPLSFRPDGAGDGPRSLPRPTPFSAAVPAQAATCRAAAARWARAARDVLAPEEVGSAARAWTAALTREALLPAWEEHLVGVLGQGAPGISMAAAAQLVASLAALEVAAGGWEALADLLARPLAAIAILPQHGDGTATPVAPGPQPGGLWSGVLEAAERCLAEALERGAGPALAGAAALDWAPAKPQGCKGQHSEFMLDLIAQFKEAHSLALRTLPESIAGRVLAAHLGMVSESLLRALGAAPAINMFGMLRLLSDVGGLRAVVERAGADPEPLAPVCLFAEALVFGRLGPQGVPGIQAPRLLQLLERYREVPRSSGLAGQHSTPSAGKGSSERFLSKKSVEDVMKALRSPTKRAK